jgi:translation initiation factor 2 subunit 3
MSGNETLQKVESESESESESEVEEEIDHIPKVEVDPSKLTPLSPEVISKQVRCHLGSFSAGPELFIL